MVVGNKSDLGKERQVSQQGKPLILEFCRLICDRRTRAGRQVPRKIYRDLS